MAYLQTLADRMYHDNRPFDSGAYLRRVVKGVAHLHKLRLIHNNINPSNTMLDKDDNAVIVIPNHAAN